VHLFMHSKSRTGGGKGHFADALTKSRESTSASTDEAAAFSLPSSPASSSSPSGLYASYEIREKSGASGTARRVAIRSRDACPVGGGTVYGEERGTELPPAAGPLEARGRFSNRGAAAALAFPGPGF